ncbi:NADPH-dependent F420 reductase [[Actinomadura] parvosata]|uniref:NADPH-dependent F420 reductase n=1 Tax=[Actinomadura] parvosata TaxID=1955412 RepID=UPI00406C3771
MSGLPVVGVIGCGRMGSACAELFGRNGFPLLLASRRWRTAKELAQRLPQAAAGSPEVVAAHADLLILAAPADATRTDLAPRVRSVVVGKPIMDVSNPTFYRTADPCSSSAEAIARALPGGCVVKALNCVSAKQLARLEQTVTVPIAGDAPAAKRFVTAVLERLGFEVADAGPLAVSRQIEGLAHLLWQLGKRGTLGDSIGFRLVRLTADPALVPITPRTS